MKHGLTISELERLQAAGKIRGFVVEQKNRPELPANDEKKKKRSKYGANKKEVDEIIFDSEKEAKRYGQLKMLLKAGHIAFLELQVPFELNEGGTHSLQYIADFTYTVSATGEKVIEDAKGYRTKEYRKKRRLMLKVHGIKIKEV
jgi:hypothetical protein